MASYEGPVAEDGDAVGADGVGDVRRESRPYVIVSFDVGVKNLACCVLATDADPTKARRAGGAGGGAGGGAEGGAQGGGAGAAIVHWTVYSLAAEKERIPTVNELSGRLFMVLDELVGELEGRGIATVDMVLLENQPSRLNGAMKSVQMMIYSYFQLRRHWEGRFLAVQMVSAGKKIQGHDCPIATPESCGYKAKKGYALNKWNAIQIAQAYIAGQDDLDAFFRGHKKRDDLADSLCQALAWVRNHGYRVAVGCVRSDIKVIS